MSSVRPFGPPRRVALAAAAVALCTGTALPAYADDVHSPETTPQDSATQDSATRDGGSRGIWGGDPSGTEGDSAMPERGRGHGRSRTESGGLTVTPSEAAPGDEIHVRVQGCQGRSARATSDAFASDAQLSVAGADESVLSAFTTIRSTTEPGAYRVRSDCDAEGTVTVVGHRGRWSRGGQAMPSAPVRAGGGGTASLAAEQHGPSVAQVVVGLGLAGGAGLAVTGIALRRRRASAQADD